MADIFDTVADFANRSAGSIFGNENLADYAHASRIFVGSNFRLNPKSNFLFHVFIDIDSTLSSATTSDVIALTELGLMVKQADLPKYSIETKTYNNYNRPNIVQSKIKFDSITITFHDDNANVVRNFWYDYYRYYFRDSDHTLATYNGDYKYAPQDTGMFGFTRRQDTFKPFLKSIRLYSLHQKRFSEYILINPIIKSFRHSQHQQGFEGTMSHDMVIDYENVLYSSGTVTQGNPAGFATLYYDTSTSPLVSSSGARNIFGPNGLVETAADIYKDLEDQDYLNSIYQTARAANTARGVNLQNNLITELTGYYADTASEDIQNVVNQQLKFNNGTGYSIPSMNATETLISKQYTGIRQSSSLPELAGASVALNGIQRKTYPAYNPIKQGLVEPPSNYDPQFPTDPGVTRPQKISRNLYITNDQQSLRTYSGSGQVNNQQIQNTLKYNIDIKRTELDNLYQDLDQGQKQIDNTNVILTDLGSRLTVAQSAPPSSAKDIVVSNLQQQIANATQLNAAAQQSVARKLLEINSAKSDLDATTAKLQSLG